MGQTPFDACLIRRRDTFRQFIDELRRGLRVMCAMGRKRAKAKRIVGRIERIDIRIGKALGRLNDRPMVGGMAKVGELADQPPLVILSVGTLAAGLALNRPRLALVGIRMTASHTLATLIKGWVKHRVDRRRPHVENGHHRIEPGRVADTSDHNSFPSGHTAGAMAVAGAVMREYPQVGPYAAAAAGAATLSRLPAAKHFPIDLLAGAVIGVVAEAIVAALLARDDRPAGD